MKQVTVKLTAENAKKILYWQSRNPFIAEDIYITISGDDVTVNAYDHSKTDLSDLDNFLTTVGGCLNY